MKTRARIVATSVAAFLFLASLTSLAADLAAREVATKLDSLKVTIAAELTARMATNSVRGSYTTVWRQFEDLAIRGEEILPRDIPGLHARQF